MISISEDLAAVPRVDKAWYNCPAVVVYARLCLVYTTVTILKYL